MLLNTSQLLNTPFYGTSNDQKALAFHDLFSTTMTTSTSSITEDTVYDVFISLWSSATEALWLDFLNSVTAEEIELAIHEMDSNKSPGTSNLTAKTAKLIATVLSIVMT